MLYVMFNATGPKKRQANKVLKRLSDGDFNKFHVCFPVIIELIDVISLVNSSGDLQVELSFSFLVRYRIAFSMFLFVLMNI